MPGTRDKDQIYTFYYTIKRKSLELRKQGQELLIQTGVTSQKSVTL